MKKIFLVLFVTIIFARTTKAQQAFSEVGFKENLGKTGTLCDTVYSLHTFSDTLTLLNMGKAYPNQKYTVAVKGNKVKMDWANMKGKQLCVTGVFILYKNRPEIEVSEPGQINAK
ncbi:MAG TPA: hypothetical protein VGI43_10225 [Mucilaginibacter sp.]